jgi:hypothetical protein
MSIRAAGRKNNVPESTLRHKYTGYHSMSTKRGPNTLLTSTEEDVLLKRTHPVTKLNIMKAVKTILEEEKEAGIVRKFPPSFNGVPKEKWWRLFLKRHPTLTYQTPEAPKKRTAAKPASKKKNKTYTSNAAASEDEEQFGKHLFLIQLKFNNIELFN